MIVQLKGDRSDYRDLTPGQNYFVIGIEADDYRILNDHGKPYLYPAETFEVVEAREPADWVAETGSEGERYAYPPALNQSGFFEDYFDGKSEAVSLFWHTVNRHLSRAA
jgi:hypothetical protein